MVMSDIAGSIVTVPVSRVPAELRVFGDHARAAACPRVALSGSIMMLAGPSVMKVPVPAEVPVEGHRTTGPGLL